MQKAMLLSRVAIGETYYTNVLDKGRTRPPPNFHSVSVSKVYHPLLDDLTSLYCKVCGFHGSEVPEDATVVYDDDAIRPAFLIVYQDIGTKAGYDGEVEAGPFQFDNGSSTIAIARSNSFSESDFKIGRSRPNNTRSSTLPGMDGGHGLPPFRLALGGGDSCEHSLLCDVDSVHNMII